MSGRKDCVKGRGVALNGGRTILVVLDYPVLNCGATVKGIKLFFKKKKKLKRLCGCLMLRGILQAIERKTT